VNLNSANNDGYNLQTQGNGNNRGGTCSGDSGGPVFLGGPDSNLIVGVTSFGLNALCRGTDFAYRVDRTEVLDWIDSH
jgi:secreted trypsin-like serine protease